MILISYCDYDSIGQTPYKRKVRLTSKTNLLKKSSDIMDITYAHHEDELQAECLLVE